MPGNEAEAATLLDAYLDTGSGVNADVGAQHDFAEGLAIVAVCQECILIGRVGVLLDDCLKGRARFLEAIERVDEIRGAIEDDVVGDLDHVHTGLIPTAVRLSLTGSPQIVKCP